MRDAVSSAMRILSDDPLILGVPVHCAMEGILALCLDFQVSCEVMSRARFSRLRKRGKLHWVPEMLVGKEQQHAKIYSW